MATKLAGVAGMVNARGSRGSAGLEDRAARPQAVACRRSGHDHPLAGMQKRKPPMLFTAALAKRIARMVRSAAKKRGLQGLCFRLRNEAETSDTGHAGKTEASARAKTAVATRSGKPAGLRGASERKKAINARPVHLHAGWRNKINALNRPGT